MKVSVFAGGLQTTLTSRILPLAKVLEERGIETEVITPIAWNFLVRGKLGNILSVALTYHPKKYVKAVVEPADIVIISKTTNLQAYLFAKILKRRNIKVIFDLDDALFLPVGSLFGIKIRPGSFYLEKIIGNADYVTTNGHFLLYYAKNFNQKVSIIHDPIDTEMFSPKKKVTDPGKVVIGWEGNARVHHRNLAMLVKPLKKIGEEYDNLKFKIASYLGDPSIKEMFSSLESIIEVDYGAEQWTTMQTFAKLIYDFDILVAPLKNTLWNEGKSALRVGIGMAMGIPVIASPVGEQKYVIKNGVNGFFAKNEEEWYNYLKMLIEDDNLRRRMGREGRKTAEKELSLEVNAKRLYEIIRNLTSR
jgi:glycosyltransferase involved in cell wall biosynthesis